MTSKDIRSELEDLVRSVQPFDGREAADQAGILDWVASGKQLFRTVPPDTPPKHLVVYFIPVDAAERCLLLGDHRKSGLWLPPGGHVEDGEDPRQAVIREAREELGIAAEFADDKPLFLTVTPTKGPNSHIDVDLWFVLRVTRRETQLDPDQREFKSVRWFDLNPQYGWPEDSYDPEMHRFAAKLQAAQSPRG
ncbi:MAG TPA: NUDIX hydrolase [Trebonia sp.]|nr:NUDIX hydrolase [Trebonia sp.]